MFGNNIFGDGLATDEVPLNDLLKDLRCTRVIPGSFRVDDSNGPALADAQAIGLGAQNTALFGELQFLQTALEELPGHKAALFVAALGRRLIAAEEDVSPRSRNTDAGGDLFLTLGQSAHAV